MPGRVSFYWHSVGNKVLTTTNMATGLNLPDMEVCYKMFRREIIQHQDREDRLALSRR